MNSNDILYTLALNSDDITALRILGTNKRLNSMFHDVFGKRYPELVKFRRSDESLKSLYLRMLKYIGLLREEFGIVYTRGNPIFIYAFKKYGVKNKDDLLIRAIRKGDLEVVRTSIEFGADIRVYDDAPLRWASKKGDLSVVKYLIKTGANVRANDNEPLISASRNGHLPVVQYLVENGANIHAADDLALRWASMSGHLPVVQYLVEGGADIGAKNDEALRWASAKGHSSIVEYLKKLK